MHRRLRLLGLAVGLVALGWAIVAPAVMAEAQAPRRGGTLRVSYGSRYAREMDPAKRRAVAKEFQEFMTAQPWEK